MSCGADSFSQGMAANAKNWVLAGRVDVHQHDHVGLIECPAKFVPKVLRARVAVGLEKHQETFEMAAACGLESSANLHRVMAIVIDQRDVIDDSLDVKSA